MLGSVTSVARSVGLEYDFSALQHTNTVKAHELLHYAKEHGKQLQAKERLLRAYFIEGRSEEHTSELQSLMRISYAVFCLKKKTINKTFPRSHTQSHTT